MINNAIDVLSTKINPKTGIIQGKDFTNIRSTLGTVAAAAPDTGEGLVKARLFRKVQKVLDDKMEDQLSGASKEAFKKDRAAWRTHVILKDAVEAASGKAGINGKFTPDNWIAAIKKNSKTNVRQGEGPLRNQAETIDQINKASTLKITSAATRLQNWAEGTRDTAITQARLRSNSEIAKLDAQASSLKKRMQIDRTVPDQLAEVAKRRVDSEATLAQADEALKEMNMARTPLSPGWFHSYAATGTIGALLGGAVGVATGLVPAALAATAAGLGAGKVLATEGVQKAIAGQGPIQTAVQQAVATPRGSQALGMIPAAPRATVGMLTGSQQQQ